jgi:hypothetical protein
MVYFNFTVEDRYAQVGQDLCWGYWQNCICPLVPGLYAFVTAMVLCFRVIAVFGGAGGARNKSALFP